MFTMRGLDLVKLNLIIYVQNPRVGLEINYSFHYFESQMPKNGIVVKIWYPIPLERLIKALLDFIVPMKLKNKEIVLNLI